MTGRRPSELPVPTCSRLARSREETHGLPCDSYTVQRLEHSSPSHLHATSRRFFVGPLPRGWLQSHRKRWYKALFGFRNYSSRPASFSALDTSLGRRSREEEGLTGPAAYRQSFPQPDDVDFDEEVAEGEGGAEAEVDGMRRDGGQPQEDAGDVVTTRIYPLDATQETQPQAQSEEIDSATKATDQSYPRDRRDGPWRAKDKDDKDRKISFPEESAPSLRPSSSVDVAQETFYTAPESKSQADALPGLSPTTTASSAPDGPQGRAPAPKKGTGLHSPTVTVVPEATESEEESPSPIASPADLGSRASLIQHGTVNDTQSPAESPDASGRDLHEEEPHPEEEQEQEEPPRAAAPSDESATRKTLDRHVLGRMSTFRFGMGDKRRRLSTRFSRSQQQKEEQHPPQQQDPVAQREQQLSACRDGEVIRAERMLVRLDVTEQEVPNEYSENESLKIETRPIEKWREYLVVCRRHRRREPGARTTPALLQLFKTRVISQVHAPQVKKRPSHEILLTRGTTHANLFSGLDKTIVIWHPYKQQQTRIVILRATSAAHSVEWYTFIRETLGRRQPSVLIVYVPDLGVSLRLKNPFVLVAAAQQRENGGLDGDLDGDDRREHAVSLPEQGLAAAIVDTCMNTLRQCPQFTTVLDLWTQSEKMALAWRRYDRLEWVQGANEQRMYGMQSMQNSHELELRPRQHYPTVTESTGPGSGHGPGREPMEEPPPVEGFMILLTSQRGAHRRWGKMYYKRLYFYTEDQYLCFCKPSRAKPPAPPRVATICGPRTPRTSEIVRESPLIYAVDPFPLQDDGKNISWLTVGRRRAYTRRHDAEAYAESRRNVANLAQAEGYINLCRVTDVRPVTSTTTTTAAAASATDGNGRCNDDSIGGDVDFHGETSRRGSGQDGGGAGGAGSCQQSKGNRTLELELDHGLVVRLRTYNQETREEWIKRLREMMVYWKARTRDDTMKLKGLRQRNLDRLEIDEQQESMLGQLGQKWEVSMAEASPELFHTCGISGCRAIKMSGQLYRKTRRRAPFVKTSVILMEGKLLIFQGSVRKSSGAQLQHTHHERQSVLDLGNCYVYSGIITGSEQLYQSQKTIDNQMPGHHSTPRIYLSDGWTSTDEDTATCFVIWRGTRKSLFRGEEAKQPGGGNVKTKYRQVRALGVPGKSMVFKTRSRAERDLWVLAIETEIDRMQQQEDLRVAS